jgi:hypothetical protein
MPTLAFAASSPARHSQPNLPAVTLHAGITFRNFTDSFRHSLSGCSSPFEDLADASLALRSMRHRPPVVALRFTNGSCCLGGPGRTMYIVSTIWATSVGSLRMIRTIRLAVFGFKKPRLYWPGSEWTPLPIQYHQNGWMRTNGTRRSFSMTTRRCDRDNPNGPKLLWLDLLITREAHGCQMGVYPQGQSNCLDPPPIDSRPLLHGPRPSFSRGRWPSHSPFQPQNGCAVSRRGPIEYYSVCPC